MSTPRANELQEFHRFVGEKVTHGGRFLSPEDILKEWRTLHPIPEMADEDLAAIQEAIDDMANGDQGMGFAEFDREFRARRGIPPS
jgi:hypothetical protein